MRSARYFIFGGALLLLTGCGPSKPQDLIIGKWEETESKDIIEFKKDGTLSVTKGGQSQNGKYQFVDDNTVEIEMDISVNNPFGGQGMNLKAAGRFTIDSISKEEMVITDSRTGKTVISKRVN